LTTGCQNETIDIQLSIFTIMGQELLDPISQLALHVFRAQQSLSSMGDALTSRWGMTSAKWKILGAIELSDSPPSASGIARIMGLTRQAATKQINLLVDQGLLTPQDNPQDARAAVYTLTPAGKATYADISSAWAQRVEALRGAIGAAEIESALCVLEQLVVQLDKTRTPAKPKLSSRKHQGTNP
jgi:DNA-binding MarR family transcriptional regulator